MLSRVLFMTLYFLSYNLSHSQYFVLNLDTNVHNNINVIQNAGNYGSNILTCSIDDTLRQVFEYDNTTRALFSQMFFFDSLQLNIRYWPGTVNPMSITYKSNLDLSLCTYEFNIRGLMEGKSMVNSLNESHSLSYNVNGQLISEVKSNSNGQIIYRKNYNDMGLLLFELSLDSTGCGKSIEYDNNGLIIEILNYSNFAIVEK